jgi:hypothetical protein
MIGIGIITYNRAILEPCLKHFAAFSPSGCKIVVVDDKSAPNFLTAHHSSFDRYRVSRKDIEWDFIDSPIRQGVAKSKNECLKRLTDCSDVFLFDDDTFPQKHGWTDLYINCSRTHNIHLLQLLSNRYYIYRAKEFVGSGNTAIMYFDNCTGACTYFTRHALDKLGGYDSRMGLYGGEEFQIGNRAYALGLTGKYKGCSPVLADEYIYCIDMHFCVKPPKIQPPLYFFDKYPKSALTNEEKKQGWTIGGKYAEDISKLYQPLT